MELYQVTLPHQFCEMFYQEPSPTSISYIHSNYLNEFDYFFVFNKKISTFLSRTLRIRHKRRLHVFGLNCIENRLNSSKEKIYNATVYLVVWNIYPNLERLERNQVYTQRSLESNMLANWPTNLWWMFDYFCM